MLHICCIYAYKIALIIYAYPIQCSASHSILLDITKLDPAFHGFAHPFVNDLNLTSAADIDDCTNNFCCNGSTCVDGVNSYTCNCPTGRMGIDCCSSESFLLHLYDGDLQYCFDWVLLP